MATPVAITYFNFSADCLNSNYIGFSAKESAISLTYGFLGGSFYFSNVTGCITNCTNTPTQISGCFNFISSGTTPIYPVYSAITLSVISGIYSNSQDCLNEHPCPVEQEYTYFKYCCLQEGSGRNNYFGILTEPGIFQLGEVYFIGVSSISACTTVVSSTGLPDGVPIYQNITYTYESYSTCVSCTGATVGCSTTPQPTPTIFFTSDTRCGDNILKRNECEPIVIFPLGVYCVGVNPELTTIANGELSLVITGGTPPYNVFWSNGSNGLYINNLSVGSYSAVVTDFYGDFTAYTTCTLTAPTPVPTPVPTETPSGGFNLPQCAVIFNTSKDVYYYNVSTNTTTPLEISSDYPTNDIAHTTNKLWMSRNDEIYEWDITLTPFTAVFNRTISLPSDISPGLGVINNNTLIAVDNTGVVSLDITTNTAISTTLFPMLPDRSVSGDIMLTTTNKVLITTDSLVSSGERYITQYNFTTGNPEVDILISPTISSPYGIFEDSGQIYIMNGGVFNNIFRIDNNSPYAITLVGSTGQLIKGASQIPNCLNADFTNSIPETGPFCLTVTTGDYIPLTYQYYLYPSGNLVNGRTEYIDGSGNSVIWNLGTSGYWSLLDSPIEYEIVTYEIFDPPLTGWEILGGPVGNITTNLGDCPGYPNLCLYFRQIKDNNSPVYTEQLTMIYNGIINGRPSWLSVDGLYTISWNSSYWQVVTSESLWFPMRSNNPQVPPLSNWSVLGATDPSNVVTVSQGNCVQTMIGTTNNTANSNQPDGNRNPYNGSILLKASSGTGPYQYSIDGGLTYRSIPLFTKLAPGTYSTVIKDASGRTTFDTVVLTSPPKPTVYKVTLETTNTKQKDNSILYNTIIKTSPLLPSGVTITFDLTHNNTFKSSTGETSASLVNSSLMKRNGRNFTANTVNTLTSTTLNTIAGCQKDFVYITGKTEIWTSVKYSNSVTLSFETITSVTKNITNKCYIGESTDNFVITNLTISGCTNCSVVNGSV